MHASFEHLLRLRDGRPVDATLAAHVRNCAECRAELAQLQQRTDDLRRLPGRSPAPELWSDIRAALDAPPPARATPRARPGWWLPAASAAAVVLAVVLTLDRRVAPSGDDTLTQAGAEADIAQQLAHPGELIEESQRLEQLLAVFPAEPRVTRASTALTVADLEDRIQWVDYRLNLSAEAGLDANQSERLWRERVELLNSLVAVRYAEARTRAF
jgi:hypothetical protein